ncbi:ParB N-terminal domain-containing protein [Georgenia sp. AZ-5]|uniref:ParB N-terminal domain-containing protein n=1 Tax=Georgenia sp. AZ-5 TaxID=3367526 RepID=UPI0037542465
MSEKDFRTQEMVVGSIQVGIRHRRDLGDLQPLMDSISRLGLLQPITVTPAGVLVCGHRRLEAIKRLGWRSTRVWVRSNISDTLTALLAQQDENNLRKPLSPLEAATLYRELKDLLAEDARRRQEASRFGGDTNGGELNGGRDSRPPHSPGRHENKTVTQAANMVTGDDSSQRLERILKLRAVMDDAARPLVIRRMAEAELDRIDAGEPVAPAYTRVMTAIREAEQAARDPAEPTEPPARPTPEEIAELSRLALEKAKAERTRRIELISRAHQPEQPVLRSPKALVLAWRELDGWTRHYDVHQVADDLSDEELAMVQRVLRDSAEFIQAVAAVRAADPSDAA